MQDKRHCQIRRCFLRHVRRNVHFRYGIIHEVLSLRAVRNGCPLLSFMSRGRKRKEQSNPSSNLPMGQKKFGQNELVGSSCPNVCFLKGSIPMEHKAVQIPTACAIPTMERLSPCSGNRRYNPGRYSGHLLPICVSRYFWVAFCIR